MSRLAMLGLATVAFVACGVGRQAAAQGLILSLPKDGSWVRFEGKLNQVEARPDAPEGDIAMEWIQHLTIKSVGSEMAVFRGKQVPCRWIEIKIQTGKASESGVDTGPVGDRVYKILVPEERVIGQVADSDKIPYAFLDIVKGYRRIGGEVAPLPPGAFQVFPLVAPLGHYDAVDAAGSETEDVAIPSGSVKAKKFKAVQRVESPTRRVTNEAEIWRCEPGTVPFGLVRWVAKTKIDRKDKTQPQSDFKTITQDTSELSVHEWGTGAKSELATN
jgi:hypothetical protein